MSNESKRISNTEILLCGIKHVLDIECDLATEAYARKSAIIKAGGHAIILQNKQTRMYNVYIRAD